MERITITSTRYHMHYDTFFLSLAWFGGYWQRIITCYTVKFIKKVYINIFLEKLTAVRGNPLQIASKPY